MSQNFINVLHEAFLPKDPERAKKADNITVILKFLGSAHEKAACKTFMRLSPCVNFINVLEAAFAPVDHKSVKRY